MSNRVRSILVGAIAVAVAAGFGWAFLNGDPAAEPRGDEVEAVGTVESISAIFSTEDPNLAEIVVVFTDPESGREYRVKDEVDFPDGESIQTSNFLREGDSRRVAYAPDDPGDARVLNDASPRVVYLGLAVLALAVAVASFAGVDLVGLAGKLPIRAVKTG